MRKTKIVCTIGPASEDKAKLKSMIEAGMNVARLNFSHGSHEEHLQRIINLKDLRREMGVPLAIMLDTRGPEIRIGKFEDGQVTLMPGSRFILTTRDIEGGVEGVSVNYQRLPEILKQGDRILLDDGLIELEVISSRGEDVECEILHGGTLSNHKSLNLPGIPVEMPYLSDRDKSDILFAIEHELDFIALSFVRTAQDVLDVKRFLAKNQNNGIELIAKIENRSGIEHIDEIIRLTAGIMVARGDMGVEIPFEELPHLQKKLIKKSYTAGKRVITATQMLESMVRNPRPTRAEITDVANAIYDGTSAIMLSGETASGKYPIEAIKTMVKIAEKTEQSIDYKAESMQTDAAPDHSIINAISHATCTTARDLEAVAIVTLTKTGSTARMISRYRPATNIIAVTPVERTYHQLALSWGVTPLMNEYRETSRELFQDAANKTKESGLAKDGDIIVITGSSDQVGEITNTLQIHVLGNILLKGRGNGLEQVRGRVHVSSETDDTLRKFREGDILVVDKTTNEVLKVVKTALGVITEEDMAASGVAAACIAMGIPVIASAYGAAERLKTGFSVVMDTEKGIVYNSNICASPPCLEE
ncbi:MAG: pyruvate kinase [Christensenellales bacterium]|jgi:pyruvate kinase